MKLFDQIKLFTFLLIAFSLSSHARVDQFSYFKVEYSPQKFGKFTVYPVGSKMPFISSIERKKVDSKNNQEKLEASAVDETTLLVTILNSILDKVKFPTLEIIALIAKHLHEETSVTVILYGSPKKDDITTVSSHSQSANSNSNNSSFRAWLGGFGFTGSGQQHNDLTPPNGHDLEHTPMNCNPCNSHVCKQIGKKKRKRVLSPKQREEANGREKRRMVSLNKAFDELKDKIPDSPDEKKHSRITALWGAINYINN